MMKKIQSFLLMLVAIPFLTGCDEMMSHFVVPDDLDIIDADKPVKQDVMRVHKIDFSSDYKTFSVTTRMFGDIGPYSLTDTTQLRVSVQSTKNGISLGRRATPRLIGMRNVKKENIARQDVGVLVLVDLTQDQETLDHIHNYIVELRSVFDDNNLYVSFIYSDSVSQTRPVSDYILNKYFVQEAGNHVLLYRSVCQKYDEMLSHQGIWANVKHMALLILSDNEIYNNATDMPFDPDHYVYEIDMAQKSEQPSPDIMVCYANTKQKDQEKGEQDILVLKHLCEQTKGIFMHSYSGTAFKDALLKAFHISPDANEFTFENPDGKVYCGNFETLTVGFYDVQTDTLVTSFHTVINKGDFYNPIIVHGLTTPLIILLGIILASLTIFVVWLLLQIVVPYIRYKYFCHKYVIRYSGHNMGVGSNMVSESCYLCKEPFETGDEVVVKCSHTMHKECWDENGYHCTEYSDRCKHGSHYYNRHNLNDSHNAPFFMKWINAAIIATTLAWIMFISRSHRVTAFLVTKLSLWLEGVEVGTPEADVLLSGNAISPLPSFGFSMGLFLTFAISILSWKLLNISYNLFDFVLRCIVAAIVCYIAFLFVNVVIVVSDIQNYAFLLEWIPWVFSAFIISFIGTCRTRVRLRKRLILPTVVIAVISMYVWWLLYNNSIDYRLVLLHSFVLYGVGLAVCIATMAPRSERYFLHVQGAVKEMDVAIFKWFRNAPDRVVTIGKSLDCSLQLSWDITGSVAPIHAEIRMYHNSPFLKALEKGVIVKGRSLEVGKKVWLRHGTSFTIANTTFTYIEKDIN